MGTVHEQCHGHGLQGILAREQVGLLCYIHHVGTLTQRVEPHGVAVQCTDHAVVDGHQTAGQTDHIDGVALHIIIIVIFLRG